MPQPHVLSLAVIALLASAAPGWGQSESSGAPQFLQNCLTCHDNPETPNAPPTATLKQMPPEHVYEVMVTGSMKQMAAQLSDEDRRLIAEFVGGRKLDFSEVGSAANMPNRCASDSPVTTLDVPSWTGWGVDEWNSRRQSREAAGLSSGQAARLELKWTFGFPGATAVYAQAAIGDHVYTSSNAGYVYSLDAETGCIHWSFRAQAGVRSGFAAGRIETEAGSRLALFFGDIHGGVYAVGVNDGELIWRIKVDPHPLSRITATPKFHEGRLYVPVASLEEPESGGALYACCTFRGMVAALEADSGKQIWKTYTIGEEPKQWGTSSVGAPQLGPSGAGVWTSPIVDLEKNALYIVTGNAFSEPVTKTSDAIMALDMDTGKVLWALQAHPNDVWHNGCYQTIPGRELPAEAAGHGTAREGYPVDNCPEETGPDWDFATSPLLAKTASGQRVIVAPQKQGLVWALDPDANGKVLWHEDVAREIQGGRGEIVFGGATDNEYLYYGLVSGGHIALRLTDGVQQWFGPFEGPKEMEGRGGVVGAVTLIPGVLFSGGRDGVVRAVSSTNGQVMWEYNALKEFETVNGVKAHGGSMGSGGPAVANGMLFIGSGYVGFQRGAPGNVLLAFGPRVRLDNLVEYELRQGDPR